MLSKSTISLGNVDNTADAQKPVSTAQQAAFDLKLNANNPAITGTPSGLIKDHVGLSNVDNTSDANKLISIATAAALAGKEATVTAGTTVQFYRGDKTWQLLDKVAVGLGNIDNTSDANKPVSAAATTALALKANLASPTFTGTVSGITKAMVGLSLVDNTADTAKPVSTATTTALNLKANLAGGTAFTGAVTISTAGSLVVASKALTTPFTLTYAATIAVNSALSNVFYCALTGNVTAFSITNPSDGQTVNIRFAQDATGGRVVTLPSSVKADGTQLTTASRVAWLSITYVASAARWEGGWVSVPA